MKRLIYLSLIFILRIGVIYCQSPANDGAWTEILAKSDEFSGTAVNTSKWEIMDFAAPWGQGYFDPAYVEVTSGYLDLSVEKIGSVYYHGGIKSQNSAQQMQFGYLEIRAQIPIDNLKEELSELIENGELKLLATSNSDEHVQTKAKLFQNNPNPFTEKTVINFAIPNSYSTASINLYDLQGKQLRSYPINYGGENELEIPGSNYQPGIYLYSLVVDGKIIDTKQLVITD